MGSGAQELLPTPHPHHSSSPAATFMNIYWTSGHQDDARYLPALAWKLLRAGIWELLYSLGLDCTSYAWYMVGPQEVFVEGMKEWKKILSHDKEDPVRPPTLIQHVSDLESDLGNTLKRRPAPHSRCIMKETSWSKDHERSWEKCYCSNRSWVLREARGGPLDSSWEIGAGFTEEAAFELVLKDE